MAMNKKISSYYKYNLFNFFHHPLFYITAVFFSVFTSAYFFYKNQFFSGNGTTDLLAFFATVPYVSIIVIPALCYKRSDQIYESFVPLSFFTRIFVRFLSVLTVYAILIITLLPVPFLVNIFGSVDWGQVFTSFICLVFYASAVISLCILISEIFESSISSFVISAVFLALFNSSHVFTVYVNLNNFFSSLCKLISFAWHFDAAGKGIIDTRDIIWFTGLTAINLFVTCLIRYKKAGKVFSKTLNIRHIFIMIIFVLVVLNGNRWYTRIDFSKNKTYSISPFTKEILSKAEGNIKITYYRSSTLEKKYPQVRDIADFLSTYTSFGKNINLKIKDPDNDEETKNLLQTYGITTHPMQSVTDNSLEYINVYSAITVEYNGNTELIPFILSAETLEYDLDGRLIHLITGATRLVNVIVGNGMGLDNDKGYNFVIPWLNSQGFVCYPLDPSNPDFAEILNTTMGPLLVIGDSQINIDAAVAIESYILSGKGNALFFVSPYSFDFDQWLLKQNMSTNIVEMLENWGIRFEDKIAADVSSQVLTMESAPSDESFYAEGSVYRENVNYPLFINLLPQTYTNLGATLFWATPILIENQENVIPYLITSNLSWSYKVDPSKEKLIETVPEFYKTQDYSQFETKTQNVGVQIRGPLNGLFTSYSIKDSNLIVIPDQYFLNTMTVFGMVGSGYGDYRNYELLTNMLLKLNGEEELAKLQSHSSTDKSLTKITDAKKFKDMKNLTNIILFVIIPLIYILSMCVITFVHYRKLKNEKI
jgi:ABC-type uncharacterized transport system involved in gliding motility auxiliary subunit